MSNSEDIKSASSDRPNQAAERSEGTPSSSSSKKAGSTGLKVPRGTKLVKYGVVALVLVLLCGASFAAGSHWSKNRRSRLSATGKNSANGYSNRGGMLTPGGLMGRGSNANGAGGTGRTNGGHRATVGQVTAISGDSITIQNSAANSTQTFKITSKTIIQNGESAATTGDIKTGSTVAVTPFSTDAATASRIVLNAVTPATSNTSSTQ